jgi:hypothetical protein
MRARLHGSRPRLVQTSLFDQRAVRAAAADRDVRRRIDEHLARRARQLGEIADALARPATAGPTRSAGLPGPTRLLAAWPQSCRAEGQP